MRKLEYFHMRNNTGVIFTHEKLHSYVRLRSWGGYDLCRSMVVWRNTISQEMTSRSAWERAGDMSTCGRGRAWLMGQMWKVLYVQCHEGCVLHLSWRNRRGLKTFKQDSGGPGLSHQNTLKFWETPVADSLWWSLESGISPRSVWSYVIHCLITSLLRSPSLCVQMWSFISSFKVSRLWSSISILRIWF